MISEKMNAHLILDACLHALFDKVSLAGFAGSGLMLYVMDNNEYLAIIPAAMVAFAAFWKHYQTARKSKIEADNAAKDSQIKDQLIAKAHAEKEIVLEMLEQERMRTEMLKSKNKENNL